MKRDLLAASSRLNDRVFSFEPGGDVTHVYNPLVYAARGWQAYIELFTDSRDGSGDGLTVFLGMNPGPWGMAQTGVPFGEITAVREWMGIVVEVERPAYEHPKRPILGYACRRSEVSGRRLWGLMAERFGSARRFFRNHLVLNYCPLVFMGESGRNITPDKLPVEDRKKLYRVCDEHLSTQLKILKPRHVIGIGAFATRRLQAVVSDPELVGIEEPIQILHPSPASPAANRGWSEAATESLVRHGLWTDSR